MATNKIVWWEKTVEYAFVLQASDQKGFKFFMPLAGTAERSGDAIFTDSESKLVLVEFKRSAKELESERDKFEGDNYLEAEMYLRQYDSHHFLVFGEKSALGDVNIVLQARTYFSRESVTECLDIFSRGKHRDAFDQYLQAFLTYKEPDGRSNGSLGADAMINVIGVSQDGKQCTIASLTEYRSQYYQYQNTEVESTVQRHVQGPQG